MWKVLKVISEMGILGFLRDLKDLRLKASLVREQSLAQVLPVVFHTHYFLNNNENTGSAGQYFAREAHFRRS